MNRKTVTETLERIDSVVDEASKHSPYVRRMAPVFMAGAVTGALAVALPQIMMEEPVPHVQYESDNSYVLAEVMAEHYMPSENGSHYTLALRTKEGSKLELTVLDRGDVTLKSLEQRIEPGTKLMFPAGIDEITEDGSIMILGRETQYSAGDKRCTKYADRITLGKYSKESEH